MSFIELKNLVKQYPKQSVKAVDQLNLTIDQGDFVVLVGPSGCGKSTTLRMLAGLEEISSGEFYFENQLYNQLSPQQRGFAMVFQNYALYPHLSVYENIAFSLRIRHVKKALLDAKVREVAQLLELSPLLSRYPSQLSGGQKQRVAIGSAIVRDPQLFLMDEPLSNLDAKLREQMRMVIARLHQELKTTVVYVTHDQVEAMTLGSKIVVMNKGKIQQVASPSLLYENPVNMFTASFIGSPAINFIEVAMVHRPSGYQLISGSSLLRLSDQQGERLAARGFAHDSFILGVRPGAITPVPADQEADMRVRITARELLGSKMILYTENAKSRLTVLSPVNYQLASGQEIGLRLDLVKALAFDPHSQENLFPASDPVDSSSSLPGSGSSPAAIKLPQATSLPSPALAGQDL